MGKAALFIGLVAVAGGISLALTSCLGARATETEATGCPPIDPLNAEGAFASVSEVMERRCGTLDCHGQAARPLRIYSSSGLRRPEPELNSEDCDDNKDCPGESRKCLKGIGCVDETIDDYGQYYPGGSVSTTPTERRANWVSMCALEPEIMTVVYCCNAPKGRCDPFDYATNCPDTTKFDVNRLTLVRKARLLERHKGGKIFDEGSSGDTCLTNWLTGEYDVTSKKPNPKAVDCEAELQKN